MNANDKKTALATNISYSPSMKMGGQTTPNPIPSVKTQIGKKQGTFTPKDMSVKSNAQSEAYGKAMNKAFNNPKTTFK